ncbi:unnamed protein product [Clonostachys rosea]|uniref:Bul1 C-terminal domain-containing protein n=1 Tax=Bionectria ochroleuca TaxID=29856 RepID=A0ABY6UZY0_BIOOC|nr:unnamed protein product [Clonostachys rosea]
MASTALSGSWAQVVHPLLELGLIKLKLPLQIDIKIGNHFEAKVYATGSAIRGKVSITSLRDVEFDKVQVDLVGMSITRTSGVLNDTLPTEFTFFRLAMPIPSASLPEDKRLAAKEIVEIPFFFVVPQQRPLSRCTYENHLELPPTIGTWEKSDQSPQTAQIKYSIRVRVTPTPRDVEKYKQVEINHYVRLLPSTFQDICVTDTTQEIRLGRPYVKSDSLTIAGIPPSLVYVSSENGRISKPKITARVEFVTKTRPPRCPRIQARSAAVQTTTDYAQVHLTPKSRENGRQAPAEQAPDVVLSSKSKKVTVDLKQSEWSKSEAPATPAGTKYSSTLTITVNIPSQDEMTFLPSFDACMISRSYALRVGLAAEYTGYVTTIDLPFQVVVRDLTAPRPPRYMETSSDQIHPEDVLPPYGY